MLVKLNFIHSVFERVKISFSDNLQTKQESCCWNWNSFILLLGEFPSQQRTDFSDSDFKKILTSHDNLLRAYYIVKPEQKFIHSVVKREFLSQTRDLRRGTGMFTKHLLTWFLFTRKTTMMMTSKMTLSMKMMFAPAFEKAQRRRKFCESSTTSGKVCPQAFPTPITSTTLGRSCPTDYTLNPTLKKSWILPNVFEHQLNSILLTDLLFFKQF